MIQDIMERLVAEDGDGKGKLMPLLMEPLGATFIVYGRTEVIEVPDTASGLPMKTNRPATITMRMRDRRQVTTLELTAVQALHHNRQRKLINCLPPAIGIH